MVSRLEMYLRSFREGNRLFVYLPETPQPSKKENATVLSIHFVFRHNGYLLIKYAGE
jgi:hypothetical protein